MSTDLETRVTARIAARKICEEIVLLVASEHRALTEAHGPAGSEEFWQNFREAFEGHFPQPKAPEPPKPMDDFEANRFEQQPLSFGQHRGKRIADVPKGYLEWLAWQEDGFKLELRRYLASERVRNEPSDE